MPNFKLLSCSVWAVEGGGLKSGGHIFYSEDTCTGIFWARLHAQHKPEIGLTFIHLLHFRLITQLKTCYLFKNLFFYHEYMKNNSMNL